MTDLQAIFNAGRVRRWHCNTALSWTDDYLDGHQGRCARLALALFPRDHVLIAALLKHDDGERSTGDIPWDVKRRMPAPILRWLNEQEAHSSFTLWDFEDVDFGIPDPQRMSLCDRLDAYMWAAHKAPHVLAQSDFRDMRNEIEALAIACGVIDAVLPVIGGGA